MGRCDNLPAHTLKVKLFSEDLNGKHLNSKLLLVCYSDSSLFRCLVPDARYHVTGHLISKPVFKWWSEYGSVNQMII